MPYILKTIWEFYFIEKQFKKKENCQSWVLFNSTDFRAVFDDQPDILDTFIYVFVDLAWNKVNFRLQTAFMLDFKELHVKLNASALLSLEKDFILEKKGKWIFSTRKVTLKKFVSLEAFIL